MANKLKDIFSNKPVGYSGVISFEDSTAYNNFNNALNEVWTKGKVVPVDGIKGLALCIQDNEKQYPITHDYAKISNVIVAPSPDTFSLELKKEDKVIEIIGRRYKTETKMITDFSCGNALNCHFEYKLDTSEITYSFKPSPTNAKTIEEIYSSYESGILLLEKIFLPKNWDNSHPKAVRDFYKVEHIKKSFATMASVFRKLHEIEKEFELNFLPKDIVVTKEFCEDIEELYEFIVAKNTLKHRDNLKSFTTHDMGIANDTGEFKVGMKILLHFLSEHVYDLMHNKITVYIVSVLLNAKIKEIVYHSDSGEISNIIYEGSDSSPLYMSYSAFKTEEDAKQELKTIHDNIDRYKNAKFVTSYIREDEVDISNSET